MAHFQNHYTVPEVSQLTNLATQFAEQTSLANQFPNMRLTVELRGSVDIITESIMNSTALEAPALALALRKTKERGGRRD
ncbi:hypothetical protein CRYUN_Cryun15aG0139800 [Craigia yunnanensis]